MLNRHTEYQKQLHKNISKKVDEFLAKQEISPNSQVNLNLSIDAAGKVAVVQCKINKQKALHDKTEDIITRMRSQPMNDLTTEEIMRMTRGGEW